MTTSIAEAKARVAPPRYEGTIRAAEETKQHRRKWMRKGRSDG